MILKVCCSKAKILFVFLAFVSLAGSSQTDSLLNPKPKLYPGWTLYAPGGTHFYDHRIVEGLLFSGIELGGITLGIVYNNHLKSQSTSPYYNFPLLLGMQAYNIDKCDWLRNRLEIMKYYNPDFKYDPVKFNDLLKAPFRPENVFKPITGAFVLVAIAELYFTGRHADHSFRNIDKMYFVDGYLDRNPALAIYGATSLAASYGAGVAEEYYFRNGIMPVWDYKLGQKKGLIYSSLFFGSVHLGNLMFSGKPDFGAALLQVAEASIAGYFLGRDVQKRDYNIGPAVAAHMWYDFILMLGSFLIDPENNFLGVSMKFKI